jgi:hypothetical protein
MVRNVQIAIAVLIVLFSLTTRCKHSKDLPPPKVSDRSKSDQKCYHNGKLSSEERKSIHPFRIANNVEIISFSSKLMKAPIVGDSISRKQVIESVILNEGQVNDLTDILYNYNYSRKTNLISRTSVGCYEPRHAIVFTYSSGKVITFIEICFECKEIRTELMEESTGVFCEGKYELLKKYFVSVGIKYFND